MTMTSKLNTYQQCTYGCNGDLRCHNRVFSTQISDNVSVTRETFVHYDENESDEDYFGDDIGYDDDFEDDVEDDIGYGVEKDLGYEVEDQDGNEDEVEEGPNNGLDDDEYLGETDDY